MTELFEATVKRVQALPEKEQDRLAHILMAEMDGANSWPEAFEGPGEDTLLDLMADTALEHYYAGRTRRLP